ncbi:MAG: CPBP family intramembrane metalloprotease [Oscillospiraceae bacterium]|nr:CPBP family intramembrane metalloprotease [Oscillospiraceae bacterium]
MNKKVTAQFLLLVFLIAVIAWGVCVIFGLFGFTSENAPWLYIFIAICAFSPTITSYVVLKRNNKVKGFKEWLKNVFAVKSPPRYYLLVVMLAVVYYVPLIVVTGLKDAKPFYMFFVLLPVVLIGGGIEEAGWSYVLRPGLDKKFGFILSSLFSGVIWTLWHIPVHLPQGKIESLSWFGLFTVGCLGLSFALGAIIRITKNVFLCVLFHTMSNAAAGTFFEYSDSWFGNILASGLLIIISIAAVFIHEKKVRRLRL